MLKTIFSGTLTNDAKLTNTAKGYRISFAASHKHAEPEYYDSSLEGTPEVVNCVIFTGSMTFASVFKAGMLIYAEGIMEAVSFFPKEEPNKMVVYRRLNIKFVSVIGMNSETTTFRADKYNPVGRTALMDALGRVKKEEEEEI